MTLTPATQKALDDYGAALLGGPSKLSAVQLTRNAQTEQGAMVREAELALLSVVAAEEGRKYEALAKLHREWVEAKNAPVGPRPVGGQMSTCEHRGPGPCPICEHVEQVSIPSSPILDFEKAHQVALAENPESKDGFEMWRDLERQAQAAVSPLLAEIEMFRASCAQYVRRIAELNDENQEKQDRLNKLYLIESNLYERLDRTEAEARDRQSEVVRQVNAKLAAQEEAQKLRETLTKADGVVQKYVKARDDFYYAESGEVERHYERLVEDAYGYLKGLPDDIRKALGGSK